MSIIPAHTCPTWCDPRLCKTWPSTLIHKSTPIQFGSTSDDTVLSVGLERRDEIGMFSSTGDVDVLLTIENTACACHCGRDLELDTALSTTDARFLMAALGVTVDKLETLLAVAR
ncbi:MAG: hypothetical protein J0I49_27345 [Pseudonocardia sp.]|uniref:hypothetical protein n=1 Tax=Pseudonocardia sp. TaxID=60912 RepID=UPI001AD56B94|nr:hypothetical protein [Pseudonocardia sp.]MBN9101783.1 hypothetical protein [Pseudonocardia sp.]